MIGERMKRVKITCTFPAEFLERVDEYRSVMGGSRAQALAQLAGRQLLRDRELIELVQGGAITETDAQIISEMEE